MTMEQPKPKMMTKVTTDIGYRFMEPELSRSLLQNFYECPTCEETSPLDSVHQEWNLGRIVSRFGLLCGHGFGFLGALRPKKVRINEVMSMFVTSEVTGPLGTTSRTVQRSHSFVGSMISWLHFAFAANLLGGGTLTGHYNSDSFGWSDTVPTVRYWIEQNGSWDGGGSLAWGITAPGMIAGAGSNGFGIVVGTATAAPNALQTVLGAPIANGSGVGQLNYGAVVENNVSITGNVTAFSLVRTFTNNTANSITATEVGLIAEMGTTSTPSLSDVTTPNIAPTDTVLFTRDLYAAAQTIPAGQTLTTTYTIQTST